MNQKKLLDSFALLAYLNQETGFKKVRDALTRTQQERNPILINEINVGETYYILFRKRGPENAEYFLDTVLASLPIAVVSNDFEQVIHAARIKAQYPLSFADCFVVATAQDNDAVILTGDPEFKMVEHLVKIAWLTKYLNLA